MKLLDCVVILFFNFMRKLPTISQWYTSFHCLIQQHTRAPFPQNPQQHLLYLVLVILAILTGAWCFLVGLVCISLLIVMQSSFSCLVAICIPC